MSCNLPINPNQSTAVVGKDFLLYVNKGTADTPVWVLVGGQRSSDLSRTAETIDTSSKSSGAWGGGMPGTLTWSLDLDAIVVLNDAALNLMECAFGSRKQIHIKLERPDGTYYTGWGAITDFSLSTPHDDVASISGTITGDGELVGPTPSVSPLAETISSTAASGGAELTFSLDPETVNVTGVSRNGVALASSDYTYSAGVLTLLTGYLSGLAVGRHSFAVITDVAKSSGNGFAELGFSVTVTA